MPETGTTAQARIVSLCPEQQPRTFSGNTYEDVDEWLNHYKRVSRYNHWDAAAQLANVVFSLDKNAVTWYENNEDTLTTWDRFVEDISRCFGDSAAKKKRAGQTLLQPAQIPVDTCTTYIEKVLKLCNVIDPRMTEEGEVGHLLKGITEDVYNFLIGREKLDSASDVVRHCRTFEALKMRRITPKFGRLALLLIFRNHVITTLPPLSPGCATCERRIGGGEGINRCDRCLG